MNQFSQGDEEAVILKATERLEGPRRVLDIGAHDGETFSNSRKLIVERKWGGTLIEPSPFAFGKLLKLYAGQKDVTLVNAAVGSHYGLTTFWDCEGDLYGTTLRGATRRWESKGIKYRSYLIPMMTPQMIVEAIPGGYDVVSLDTEGTSFEILKILPMDAWCPHVIIVEHDERAVEISEWGRTKGFDIGYLDQQNLALFRVNG